MVKRQTARRTPPSRGRRVRRTSETPPSGGRKVRVGIIFGGQSGEHQISLMSAQSVMRVIDKEKYEVVPIGITREGRWLTGGDPLKELTGGQVTMRMLLQSPVSSHPASGIQRALVRGERRLGIPPVDVIFPVLHGPMGEDGTVQGLLELAGIPYIGAGVMASAVGMDKAVMKDVFRAHGLPVAPYLVFSRGEWERDPVAVMAKVETPLGFPCFVKPANLGSSVGITKVHGHVELDAAIAAAASFDRRILVEAAVSQAREIECAVLGNDDPIASVPGEVKPAREFYDYEAKYFDERTQLIVPAPLPEELSAQVRDLAVRAFRAVDCAGMARVDFLLSGDTGDLYLSEVNTIPGFTAVSMYPKMWEASGLAYRDLIDRLIQLALERHEDKRRSRMAQHGGETS